MKKAHVFKYSQMILTDRKAAIANFSDHSGLSMQAVASIAINQEKPNGVIDRYKTGEITTEEFRNEMNRLIEEAGGKPITNIETFDNCWNAMCIVEPEKLTKLHDLQHTHDFHIHITGGTNELQHNFIQKGISSAPHNPNMTYTLSYELGTLDNALLVKNANDYLQNQGYEPVWHTHEQKQYEQNALEILGNYYNEVSS